MNNSLDIESLTVAYEGKAAIQNVNLKLELGKFHVVMGPNGGGKTTLIKAIAGLVPYSGKITINGMDMRKYRKLHSIGYLAQRGSQFCDLPLSAVEVVEMGRYRFKESSKERRRKALQFLQEVKMTPHANRPIRDLSGGQQQRVLVARALAVESHILLMDEPLTGMDPKSQSNFYEMIEKIKERHDLTIIMSSHDVGFTTAYAQNIFCINKKLVPHREVVKLLNEPEIVNMYGANFRLAKHFHLPSEEDDV